MSRPLRLDLPGALYHVTARGNAREAIYRDDHDRTTFLALLGETCARYGWTCYAYCLMTNHYHLLLALREVPAGRLVRGVQHLNSRSAYHFNQRNHRVGHVYQGRYKAILVQRERHLLELTRYVVLNPVRARMVDHAAAWPWSSYRATAGLAPVPTWLDTDAATAPFGSGETGRRAYADFVAAGAGEPSCWSPTSHQIYLGDQSFVTRAQRQAMTRPTDIEVPTGQRGVPANPPTGTVLTRAERDAAITNAYISGGETIKTLGLRFGLHYSQVSRILHRTFRDATMAAES